ncbi:HTH domain-containing protein, partial [Jeotgalibaca sp. A127]|uniref:HTH domain-containing protein n=1 Tax=Jeotgalibaca sp. A127 TaxID=3457324 RepID=UPI003FD182BB
MSKRLFTDVEVAEIAKNPFVKRVSNKGISYTDDFKVHFIVERQKGKFNNQIFQEAGFPVETLGEYRINSFADRWMKRYRAKGIEAIKDNRKGASGRPRLTELSTEEKLKRAQLEIELLKQENELLKKLDFAERRGNELTKAEKFRLIKEAADRPHSLP